MSDWGELGAYTDLHGAVFEWDHGRLRRLLERRPGMAAVASRVRRTTALHSAAQVGNLYAAEHLVGTAPEAAFAVDSGGKTPLHLAAHHGHVSIVEILLDVAPDAAKIVDDHLRTPLHYAAAAGCPGLAALVLAAAPEMAAARDESGRTPTHVAARHGCARILRLLVGASPRSVVSRDARGRTPLHHAAAGPWPLASKVLYDAAPDALCVTDADGSTPVDASLRWEDSAWALARHLPFTPDQWAEVALDDARVFELLPAVAARSRREAALAAARLSPGGRARLVGILLCAARLGFPPALAPSLLA